MIYTDGVFWRTDADSSNFFYRKLIKEHVICFVGNIGGVSGFLFMNFRYFSQL